MATPFPTSRSASGSTRLFPYSVAATFVTIGLPFASVILVNHLMGFEGVPTPALAVISVMSAIVASALGAAVWMQHPASNEVSYGDLMIWSWARSAQARRKLVRSFKRLTDETEVMSPLDRLATLREMSAALDRKDPYTYGHSRRVERLANRTGLVLGLNLRDLQDLREAASIHDVGKIYVPDEILLKRGSLTDDEYSAIKAHSVMGAEMVAFLGRPAVTDTVRFHHERWDGKGYPDGVSADEIPLSARIVGTADAYDAMTSMRAYRGSLGHKRAVEILVEEKDKQFDAAVVVAFLSALRNPVLAAVTIPLLSGPIEGLRRFLGWMGRSARTDLATAAGVVGMTVAITGLTLGNLADGPRRPEVAAPNRASALGEKAPDPNAEGAADRSGSRRAGREVSGGKQGRAGKEVSGGKQGRDDKRSPGKHGGRSAAPTGSNEAGTGGSADATETRKGTEFDPEAATDPKPGKGKDCSGHIPDRKGGSLHCGH